MLESIQIRLHFANARIEMKREIAIELKEASELKKVAEDLANFFSRPERKVKYTGEDFKLEDIYPLSDESAAVVYQKTGGKRVAIFFFYVGKKRWEYLIPSDSHIVGMESFAMYKLDIERINFGFNFVHRETGEEG